MYIIVYIQNTAIYNPVLHIDVLVKLSVRYKLYSDDVEGYQTGKIVGSSSDFTVQNLTPGTDYTFKVTCEIEGIEVPGISTIVHAHTTPCISGMLIKFIIMVFLKPRGLHRL